jgi:hypothetical protein
VTAGLALGRHRRRDESGDCLQQYAPERRRSRTRQKSSSSCRGPAAGSAVQWGCCRSSRPSSRRRSAVLRESLRAGRQCQCAEPAPRSAGAFAPHGYAALLRAPLIAPEPETAG